MSLEWVADREQMFRELDYSNIKTPALVIHAGALEDNMKIVQSIKDETGVKILLALKGYAIAGTFPLMNKTIDGMCASSFNEARFAKEHFSGEIHTYSPSFSHNDISRILPLTDHVVFNSKSQLYRFYEMVKDKEIGLRLNLGFSASQYEQYNPNNFGVKAQDISATDLKMIRGMHFHVLCEQNADALEKAVDKAEEEFGDDFKKMKWLNFGGGHFLSWNNYGHEKLCKILNRTKDRYGSQIYMEPGAGLVINTAVYVASVNDIVTLDKRIAFLDISTEAHMPDILLAPYRPKIINAGEPDEKKHNYLLRGNTCAAGDIIGEFSFDNPLEIGQKLVFLDMAHYTTVKTNFFNGVDHPSIIICDGKKFSTLREYTYFDFANKFT